MEVGTEELHYKLNPQVEKEKELMWLSGKFPEEAWVRGTQQLSLGWLTPHTPSQRECLFPVTGPGVAEVITAAFSTNTQFKKQNKKLLIWSW